MKIKKDCSMNILKNYGVYLLSFTLLFIENFGDPKSHKNFFNQHLNNQENHLNNQEVDLNNNQEVDLNNNQEDQNQQQGWHDYFFGAALAHLNQQNNNNDIENIAFDLGEGVLEYYHLFTHLQILNQIQNNNVHQVNPHQQQNQSLMNIVGDNQGIQNNHNQQQQNEINLGGNGNNQLFNNNNHEENDNLSVSSNDSENGGAFSVFLQHLGIFFN